MPRYFYYRRGEEWVRVLADSFTQGPPPSAPGQCENVGYVGLVEYTRGDGLVQVAGTGAVWGPVTGVFLYPLTGGNNVFIGCHGSYYGAYSSEVVYLFVVQDGATNYTHAEIIQLYRIDGLPDDCAAAGGCQTEFFLNGNSVLVIPTCPEVLDSSEENECSDCCRQLLPLARSIRF